VDFVVVEALVHRLRLGKSTPSAPLRSVTECRMKPHVVQRSDLEQLAPVPNATPAVRADEQAACAVPHRGAAAHDIVQGVEVSLRQHESPLRPTRHIQQTVLSIQVVVEQRRGTHIIKRTLGSPVDQSHGSVRDPAHALDQVGVAGPRSADGAGGEADRRVTACAEGLARLAVDQEHRKVSAVL
jgi:hypothetical protein